MKTTKSEAYVSPILEIIEIKTASPIAASSSVYGDNANEGGEW